MARRTTRRAVAAGAVGYGAYAAGRYGDRAITARPATRTTATRAITARPATRLPERATTHTAPRVIAPMIPRVGPIWGTTAFATPVRDTPRRSAPDWARIASRLSLNPNPLGSRRPTRLPLKGRPPSTVVGVEPTYRRDARHDPYDISRKASGQSSSRLTYGLAKQWNPNCPRNEQSVQPNGGPTFTSKIIPSTRPIPRSRLGLRRAPPNSPGTGAPKGSGVRCGRRYGPQGETGCTADEPGCVKGPRLLMQRV